MFFTIIFSDIRISYSRAYNFFCKMSILSYHNYCCLSKVANFNVLHFSFVHAPACANCNIFLNITLFKKYKICLLLNWKIVHCELYVFSFSFVHTPVCANCKSDSCNCILFNNKKKQKQKKNKKNKKKNDPYFGMGKNTKVMPQKMPLSIFFLGKGRESLHLQNFI